MGVAGAALAEEHEETPNLEIVEAAPESPTPQADDDAESAAQPGVEPVEVLDEAAETPGLEEEAPGVDEGPPWKHWMTGSFEAGADADFARSAHDIDLHQWLRLNVTPPEHPNLRIVSSLWMTQDLDGDESGRSALYDIDNAYGSDFRARVLSLYLEAKDVAGGATMRLGRQRILDGPLYNRIDGLHLKWASPRWDLYLYGGARASLYGDTFDNLVLGGGAGFRPFDTTRLGVDLYYADDHRSQSDVVQPGIVDRLLGRAYPRSVKEEIDNTLIALSLNQRLGQNTYFYAQLKLLDDVADELRLDLNGYWADADLTYTLSYRRQMERVQDRVNDLTGFYRILGPQEKYDHVYVSLYRPITAKLALSLEADFHDADADGPYTGNRDYIRLGAILSASEIAKNTDASLGVERWDVDDGEDAWVVTGEVVRRWDAVQVTVGADYERWRDELVQYNPWPLRIDTAATYLIPGLYPRFTPLVYLFDTNRVEVRENIYSIYTRVKWDIKANQRVSGRVVFEDDDSSDAPYWRVQAAYEIDF
jgi:hypothetical protein